MNKTETYFQQCKSYWMRNGDPEGIATIKALWWDCAEVWNASKSWDEEKINFFKKWRNYKPYSAIPEEKCIMEGNA